MMGTPHDWLDAHTSPEWSTETRQASLWDLVLQAGARHPLRTAIVQVDQSGETVGALTYEALIAAVRQRQQEILGLGEATGLRAAVSVRNSTACIVDVFSLLSVGASVVLVDVDQTESRRREQVERAADLILNSGNLSWLRRTKVSGRSPMEVAPPFEREAFAIFTTGSTAAQKAVIQSDHAVVSNVLATVEHHRMAPGEVMACTLPISHVNGLHFGVLAPLVTGGTCILFESFNPLTYLSALVRYAAQRASVVPSLLRSLVDGKWPRLVAMKYFVSAAAALDRETAIDVFDRSGLQVVQGYGLSETMNFATTMPPWWSDETYCGALTQNRVLPVGVPLRGVDVQIETSDAGITGRSGVPGEVVVRGNAIMNGYLDEPTLNAQAFRGGWFHTGDLGYMKPLGDGRSGLVLTGRMKNVATCGGRKVSLEEIDRWLRLHPAIADCCSISVEHRYLGESVTTFVVAVEGFDRASVADHLATRFDPRSIGFSMVRAAVIPTLRSGKVDRLRLRESLAITRNVE
jgi:acyl-CoA synthetase (AMP-forming)/AMP-acid ligase II